MSNGSMYSNSPGPKEYSASNNIKSLDISDPAPYGGGGGVFDIDRRKIFTAAVIL